MNRRKKKKGLIEQKWNKYIRIFKKCTYKSFFSTKRLEIKIKRK
jgi:hypothetical protein